MTLLFVDSFNHYATADLGKKWTSIGTQNYIVAAKGRRGGAALRGEPYYGTAMSKYIGGTSDTIVVGFAITQETQRINTVDYLLQFREGATTHISVGVNSTGNLTVKRGTSGGTLLGTSSNVLAVNTTYFLEFKMKIHDSAGTVDIHVDGSSVLSLTGQDTMNGGTGFIDTILVLAGLSYGSSLYGYISDLYICDSAGTTNNNFLGDCRVDVLYPTSDGNYAQFTPSTGTDHYALVDETAPNLTDHNDGANINDRDSYGLGNLTSLVSQTVYGVQVNAAILKDDAGTRGASTMVRSNTTNADGTAVALGTSQVFLSQVYELNPDGSVAWTQTSVNAMEAGVKVTS